MQCFINPGIRLTESESELISAFKTKPIKYKTFSMYFLK